MSTGMEVDSSSKWDNCSAFGRRAPSWRLRDRFLYMISCIHCAICSKIGYTHHNAMSLCCYPLAHHFFTNSGFCSIVWLINPLNASHLLAVGAGATAPASAAEAAAGPAVVNCAMFFPNRSLSIFSSFSLLFCAPGLVLTLLCLILASPVST